MALLEAVFKNRLEGSGLAPCCGEDSTVRKGQLTLTLSEVPEPGTLLLVGSGATAVVKRRRRKPQV